MPIYAYKCETCGHSADVLQKISEPVLTQCPACGASTYVKQVTAAGFQLKGSGWYVTDFRDGDGGKKSGQSDSAQPEGDAKPSDASSAAAPASAPAASPAPTAPAAAPAASPGPSA